MHNCFRTSLFLLILIVSIHAQMPDRYVILVIVDGARYSETLGDTSGRFAPNLKRLATEGVVIDSFFNNGWTVTNRGVPAIWSGSWSTPLDTFYNGFQTQYATVPTLWEYFRKAHQQDSTEAMYIFLLPGCRVFVPIMDLPTGPGISFRGATMSPCGKRQKTCSRHGVRDFRFSIFLMSIITDIWVFGMIIRVPLPLPTV